MSFVHLNVHSHYSPLQASCTIPELVDTCRSFRMPALALTDYGNMFGALEFYFYSMEKGIKPILGLSCYYMPQLDASNKKAESHRLILLAKDNQGYKNLCMMNTLGYQKGFFQSMPYVDYKIFDQCKEGIIAVEGDHKGKLFSLFKNKNVDQMIQEVKNLKSIFGDSFYLSFQPEVYKEARDYNVLIQDISKKSDIPIVAQNNVHYVKKQDSFLQEVLYCIGTNNSLYDRSRESLGPDEFYFKSEEEMLTQFKDDPDLSTSYKQACERTLELADRCFVEFKTTDEKGLPIYHLPRNVRDKKWGFSSLKKLTEEGLKIRLQEARNRGEPLSPEQEDAYKERIDYELKIINQMGFIGYFHIVEDFIRWSKNNQVYVGPGRGSGASSLVSYCLRITDLDPMPLNLIFERFLNPERISMPDFDIDFCQENRHRVIQYINDKYGSDCTSHVITYGRLSVRAAIRDAGRVLGLSYRETDQIAKLIPNKLGITLSEALKVEPKLKERGEEDPQIAQLLKVTGLLEGLIRHVGIHAAGIIIADNPIIEYAPLYRGAEGENVIQYDLKYAEKIGLVKFDFLGLKTLTHITETFRLIKLHRKKVIDGQKISLKDSGIYEIMKKGDTVGVFQFEGRGITDLLIKAQPDCFEDIVAINALYRPGPMKMIPSYLDRKNGKVPVNYIFPELESILKETYGIIVYQEHVHQIAVEIAGYTYGEADVLRRAMGKKIRKVMEKQKDRFIKGAKKKNYDLKKAEELFNLMAEFAKYGFNKSHAAAYCVLAAQTAWLKYYYPVEFFASYMTVDTNDSEKMYVYYNDARKHNIQIVPPHINHSTDIFSVGEKKIYFSLTAVKGVGASVAKAIYQARSSMPDKKFKTIEEFFEQVDIKKINRKAFENLVKAGAFDNFGFHRREILENYDRFLKHFAKIKEDKELGQQNLFESPEFKQESSIEIPRLTPWSHQDQVLFEKEVIGFYLENHPLKLLQGVETFLKCNRINKLHFSSDGASVKILCLVESIKKILTRKNKMMAFCQLEDGHSSIEAIVFPKVYGTLQSNVLFEENTICIVHGKLKKEAGNNCQVIIEKLAPFTEDFENVSEICINLSPHLDKKDLAGVKNILQDSEKGPASLSLKTYIPEKKIFVEIDPKGVPHDIQVSRALIEKINSVLKYNDSIQLS